MSKNFIEHGSDYLDGYENETDPAFFRQKLMDRCKVASIESEIDEDDNGIYVYVGMPNGRKKRF